jgi:hypothetical protein
MDKIRVELLVVTKKLRTRLLNGSAGNWPIPRSIDPHAHALSHDATALNRLMRDGFDEINRKTVAAAPARKQASVAAASDDDSDDETPVQRKEKKAKASAPSSASASSSSASSSSKQADKTARIKSMQPLAQLESMKEAGFKHIMFDLCPSVIRNEPCKMPAGKCHFWHLCATCVKDGVDLATCLTRRHCDHKSHI